MTPGQIRLAMTSVEAHEAAVDALRRFRFFAGVSLDPVKVQVRVGDGKSPRDMVEADIDPAIIEAALSDQVHKLTRELDLLGVRSADNLARDAGGNVAAFTPARRGGPI
jgi:hypothetical protein